MSFHLGFPTNASWGNKVWIINAGFEAGFTWSCGLTISYLINGWQNKRCSAELTGILIMTSDWATKCCTTFLFQCSELSSEQRPEMKFRFEQGYEEAVFSVLFMQYGDELSIIVDCRCLGFQSCWGIPVSFLSSSNFTFCRIIAKQNAPRIRVGSDKVLSLIIDFY